MDKKKIEDLQKKLEGLENTIWAYKFEFHDLDDEQRKDVIEKFEHDARILKAKIKSIEIIDKLKK